MRREASLARYPGKRQHRRTGGTAQPPSHSKPDIEHLSYFRSDRFIADGPDDGGIDGETIDTRGRIRSVVAARLRSRQRHRSKACQGDSKAEHFTSPSCVDCPRTDYTDGALKAQIQGEITMRMLVSKHGDPLKIVVLQGLLCGLNRKALETVRTWRLNPAKTSDGSPIEVWRKLEITLQLY